MRNRFLPRPTWGERVGRVFSLRIRWDRLDWPVLGIGLVLVLFGMGVIYAMGEVDLRYQRLDVSFSGHAMKVLVALPMLAIGLALRPRWLKAHSLSLFGVCLILLFLVPFIGEERNNAKRWIPLPILGFDLQPSELVKLGLILCLARLFYRNHLRDLKSWLLPGAAVLLPMGLVALQPDLGTALAIVPIGLGMFYLAGARARVLLSLVLVATLFAAFAWTNGLVRDYQMRRVDTWAASFDPATLIDNQNGAAFHTYHARVAVGNGGWRGTGLGQGIANQAGHLPERESDSIFCVVAEEGGFVGGLALIVLYVAMVGGILTSAGQLRDRFQRLAVGGIALYFGSQFLINIAVNLGLLPMTGLTLPLVSTGGSSLLASFLALGLALGLAAHPEPALDGDAFGRP